MSLRRIDSIIAELLPKLSARYISKEMRDDKGEACTAITNQVLDDAEVDALPGYGRRDGSAS